MITHIHIEHDDGTIVERYYTNRKLHRADQPAVVQRYHDGAETLVYYREGKKHRDDGPALIAKDRDGGVWTEEFYRDGKRHREDGPAYLIYDPESVYAEYWVAGQQVAAPSVQIPVNPLSGPRPRDGYRHILK